MSKTNKSALYLTLFLTIFIPFRELIAEYTVSYAKFIPDILIWLFAFIVIIKSRFRLQLKTYDFAFAGFILFGLISTLVNSTSLLAFALQVRSIGTMYVFFYVLRNIKFENKHYQLISKVLMAVVSLLTLLAIIEFLSDKTVLFPEAWSQSIIYASNFARTYSLMNNPNTFAFFCFMAMIYVYYINRSSQKLIHYIFYAIVFLAILLSASRSTFIVVVLFLGFLIIKAIREKGIKSLMKMAAAIVAALVVLSVLNPIKGLMWDSSSGVAIVDRFEEMQSDEIITESNTDGRLFMIKKGFEIFADHPVFGTGFGTYGSAGSRMVTPELYKEYDLNPSLYADNEYIKVIVETGIFGILMYAIFILSLFKSCFKNAYKMLAFLAFMFIGMFYNIFEIQSVCMLAYLIFVCTDNTATEGKNNETIPQKTIQ